MTDSTTTQQQPSTPPIDRPSWRFSGRRGTPVHLREQAPATLPKEIRQAIVQMTREQARTAQPSSSERSPSSEPRSNLAFTKPDAAATTPTPPVAGARVPVERRAQAPHSPEQVSVSPIIVSEPAKVEPEPTAQVETEPAKVEPEPAKVEPEPAKVDTETKVEAKSTPPAASNRKRRARAKSKAKAQAKARTQSKPRLLARDRVVPVTEAIAIEPSPPVVAPDAVDTPVTPLAITPDVLPASVFDARMDMKATSDADERAIVYPPPSSGFESGSQAAWELGRLPILLDPIAPVPIEPNDVPTAPEPPTLQPPLRSTSVRTTPHPEPEPEPEFEPVVLRPVDWLPIGSDPTPKPLYVAEAADRPTPPAIARLSTSKSHSSTRARAVDGPAGTSAADQGGRAPAIRAAEARHRVGRRRRELGELVEALAHVQSPRDRDVHR